ncbi:MAG: DUF3516 domain-containing protein [Actinomycetota bacterium]
MTGTDLVERSRSARRRIDGGDDPADTVLTGFLEHAFDLGIELYPAQEEAIVEVAIGRHVIVNTPTGSGKSMVATAAHFAALTTGRRSWYTAPIKALVSEKFFALCRDFGSDNVGMITGDASVNPDAPIICCTAEILAHAALRDGADAPVDVAIVDEFHYYGDEQRGWAWQLPLLELTRTQFVLMSATLGEVEFFRDDLEQRSGRPCSVVSSATRPVPLDFEYRTTTLHRSVEDLLAAGRAPIYVVHFTQKEATDAAQGYVALDPLTKDQKQAVKEAIGGFRFDSPIGKDLRRFLTAGVGVHHAGLLPKYRLLVEKLAQDGLLQIICGTDTLGVGVNVPIRSVLFTKLCKYDGRSVRILSNRDFAQIAGRAGRKGFDDRGDVWVQAPEHVVDNLIADEKAAAGGKKAKVRKKPPERGYAHWDEQVFDKLVGGRPETLRSHFRVDHQMVMSLLDRPVAQRAGADEDGCGALRRLLRDNHETRRRQRGHVRRAIAVYRSLVEAGVLEFLDEPDELGRRVRVTFDLQDEFALHQPLSLWALDAIGRLHDELLEVGATDAELDGDVQYALDVVTIIEAVAENPGVVLAAQENEVKQRLLAQMKADGVEYEERMERLAEAEAPKPNKEWLYGTFNEFRSKHPWVGGDTVRPKSVVRELYERAMTFGEFVHAYGLKRSEGVVLRYLSDVYKGLVQNVPEEERTEALDDVVAWIGAVVRQVDSSLIDEWERLIDPDESEPDAPVRPQVERTILDDERALRVMVRNTIFGWIESLARRERLDVPGAETVDSEVALAPYWAEHGEILTGPQARGGERFVWDPTALTVSQILHDPDETNEWRIDAAVDREASIEADRPILVLRAIRRV